LRVGAEELLELGRVLSRCDVFGGTDVLGQVLNMAGARMQMQMWVLGCVQNLTLRGGPGVRQSGMAA